jgi:hypothetical protein
MAHSYKFSLIHACPSSVRAEQVNVGIVVAGPNGLDVRLPEMRKLQHLTGHKWDDVASAYANMLTKQNNRGMPLETVLGSLASYSEVFQLGRPGELVANTHDEYEAAIKKLLNFFVDKPSLSRREKQQKINSEISSMLKKGGLLGDKNSRIEEGKVIPRFVISEEKEIVADFAYKPNGLKVVSTLDLRGLKNAAHGKACEKGATLYFARQQFGQNVKPLGVYAADPAEAEMHYSEIEILSSFAEGNAYNWLVPRDRQKFQHELY